VDPQKTEDQRDETLTHVAGRAIATPRFTMKNKQNRTFVIAFVVCLSGLFAFTGCRTMDGLGQDVERAGESIQDAADR
jgi:predicted small secreted protein